MRTKTEFYVGFEAWHDMVRGIREKESDTWSVRQVIQSNGAYWVVVFEKDENL